MEPKHPVLAKLNFSLFINKESLKKTTPLYSHNKSGLKRETLGEINGDLVYRKIGIRKRACGQLPGNKNNRKPTISVPKNRYF
ncbi:hypothetical protein EHQ23_15750 [Leptospira bourretii]|uniref:Uncharacterized protein n=1 Tax=Leptospira bourretii TaxID=2484962 RepID=A0A4R9IRL4_9LEPT|nr:hypothetical protein EHQ23_15750 [Leptospira bourretii]TGK94092.1 hypothetical protein EHQ26_03570 [Leptospira bourretii]TGL26264.1 hypothetical protein EHQ47_01130 [Leptospira bourretii]TGL26354.1 hypothetical protein EHQ45_20070 [Leptospira bourretii]